MKLTETRNIQPDVAANCVRLDIRGSLTLYCVPDSGGPGGRRLF